MVLTSSVAAIGPPQDWWEKPYELDKQLTPEDWNTTSTVERGAYRLSKRLAEELGGGTLKSVRCGPGKTNQTKVSS